MNKNSSLMFSKGHGPRKIFHTSSERSVVCRPQSSIFWFTSGLHPPFFAHKQHLLSYLHPALLSKNTQGWINITDESQISDPKFETLPFEVPKLFPFNMLHPLGQILKYIILSIFHSTTSKLKGHYTRHSHVNLLCFFPLFLTIFV